MLGFSENHFGMVPIDLTRLTDSQRVCLRLVAHGMQAKEIARELGITQHATIERLRAARRATGAATSREIALQLIKAESGPDYKPLVAKPIGVAPTADHPASSALPNSSIGAVLRSSGADENLVDRAGPLASPKRSAAAPDFWRLPFRTRKAQTNELTVVQTLISIGALALMLSLAAIAAIAFVEQLIRLYQH